MTHLLDTHVFLWWHLDRKQLSRKQRAVVERASDAPVAVSDITLWEVALLVELGRVELDVPLGQWLELASAPPLVERLRVTPVIAAEVAILGSSLHRDPADRILVATARVHGLQFVTSDRAIAASRLVPVVG
jgi:PIN domain nuclease of toxin-antitoxin system